MDDSSKEKGAIVPYEGKKGEDLIEEKIDDVILRLLGLEDVFDLDYETYATLLKESLVKYGVIGKDKIPTEEIELLRGEFKRIKGKKGRFKPQKKITAESFRKKSPVGIEVYKNILPTIAKPSLNLGSIDKDSKKEDVEGSDNAIVKIQSTLTDIIKILDQQNKDEKKKQEKDRKKREDAKRKKKQKALEAGAGAVFKLAEKVLAPVKSLLSRIIDFITAVFFGRAIIKLINWFSDKKNKDKVDAIFRFLGDNWPKLLSLYLLFGTSFGRFALGLTKSIARGAVKLLAKIALLAAAKKIKGARGVAKFLRGGKGKLIANVAATGLAVAGTYAATNMLKGGEDKPESKPKTEPTQKLAGGGSVRPRFPAFGGGGFNFKGMMGGAALGGMFGPLGMLMGGAFGSGKPQQMVNGFVSGQKGVDKVPAMLSDGEFVMSRGAVQKYGVDTLEAMNAAGGGTNKPKIMSGVHHAATGGYIGNKANADKATDSSSRKNTALLKQNSQSQKMLGGSGSGRPEYKEQYDRTHGAGAYAKELARRRAITNAQDDADIALKNKLQNWRQRSSAKPSTQKRTSGNKKITVNGINVTGLQGLKGLRGMGPNVTITRDNKMTPEMQTKLAEENKKSAAMDASMAKKESLHKKARSEYAKILNNPDDPRYQDAWDGKLKLSDIRKQLESATPAAKPAPTTKPSAPAPVQSSREERRHQRFLRNEERRRNTPGWFQPGGLFGGPRMKARTDYAASKGKYYSSSDQKTYGSYNDAMAAKKSRMTSLASQQRLNRLSNQIVGRGGRKRDMAENLARMHEDSKRGGDWGKLGRVFTSMFGTGAQIAKNAAEDKASAARVKQAGAASIGRYYSTSDGKYYKDYAAAKKARDLRLASAQKRPGAPGAPSGSKVKVVHTSHSNKGSAKPSGSGGAKPNVPSFGASHPKRSTRPQDLYGLG